MASRTQTASDQQTWFTDTRAADDAGKAPTAAFVAGQVVIAFALMLAVSLAGFGLYMQGLAFLLAHTLAAAIAYRALVAPRLPEQDGALKSQAEKIAAGFALFAVAKHLLLLILGRLGALTGGLDRALVWAVDTAYLNTSLLPDVTALALIGLTVNAVEKIRSGRI
ncbi:hypothetical protein CKO28_14525 [Rhodovibrio sodomensis]|uniref:DUF2975 domain-containing protein n=1 Tax=Rhodovibrio sodomensis TaxID=1088 RepID=A0ABS1DFK6_9PROT|nr:hypothetical protein [Rhodovibrio sodomensis]MBK1669250.1 hypothetical protein [Rhodovibrio sodomensis]